MKAEDMAYFSCEGGGLFDKNQTKLHRCLRKDETLEIPASVTSIDGERLGIPEMVSIKLSSPDLVSINVVPLNVFYCSVDGVLFSKDMSTLIRCPEKRTGCFTIPDGVMTILGLHDISGFERMQV